MAIDPQSAFGKDGAPTKALEGFLRKNGASASDVTREADAKGVEYCFVTVKDAGRAASGELVLVHTSRLQQQTDPLCHGRCMSNG